MQIPHKSSFTFGSQVQKVLGVGIAVASHKVENIMICVLVHRLPICNVVYHLQFLENLADRVIAYTHSIVFCKEVWSHVFLYLIIAFNPLRGTDTERYCCWLLTREYRHRPKIVKQFAPDFSTKCTKNFHKSLCAANFCKHCSVFIKMGVVSKEWDFRVKTNTVCETKHIAYTSFNHVAQSFV